MKRASTFLGAFLLLAAVGLISAGAACGDDYLIAPSDVMEIMVYGEESLTKGELIVRPDGKVSFPLVGDLQAGGLTTEQVRENVEAKIHEYIPEAVVAVSVKVLGSLQYYIVGKVAKPGMYNVSKPLTVLQALALAGGPIVFAKEDKISVVRNAGGKTVQLPFDYEEIKKGKNLDQNIVLERGDVVVVP